MKIMIKIMTMGTYWGKGGQEEGGGQTQSQPTEDNCFDNGNDDEDDGRATTVMATEARCWWLW